MYPLPWGHYVADAHVPLHCSEKLQTDNLPTRSASMAFWESRLPELYGENYDYFTGQAHFIEKPQMEAWNIV
jgi:hypothetical protein